MTDDIKYATCMEEIKLRQKAITNISDNMNTTTYEMTNIEFVCLQFRKILELIAMASLVANKDQYERVYAKFFRHWKAKQILKDIKGINPNFYPVPTKQVIVDGKVVETINITDGYLTMEDFDNVYNECSEMLHSKNPYNKKTPDLEKLKEKFVDWNSKIITLLSHHQVQLYQSDLQLWVLMQAKEDGRVHVATMKKITKK